jgi:hypothetical protein
LKKCSKCGEEKPFDCFWYIKDRDWYSAACKDCYNKIEKHCLVCGNKFYGSRNKKLCSKECSKIYRPQSFLKCKACGNSFGPVDRLDREYCSKKCWYENIPKRADYEWEYTKEARSCARKTRYLIFKGEIKKPKRCKFCKEEKILEAAHINYDDPKNIIFLCRSCHRKFDKNDPKNGCIKRWQDFTGKTAIKEV